MSQVADLDDPICDYCGMAITDDDQQCAARDDGEVCYP